MRNYPGPKCSGRTCRSFRSEGLFQIFGCYKHLAPTGARSQGFDVDSREVCQRLKLGL